MKHLSSSLASIIIAALTLSVPSISLADKPFPGVIPTLMGSQSEGFAIGKGTTAFNGSPDGSIYKLDLRTGQGDVLVPVQDPMGCSVLGMRVDPRTNYLFVAGCITGSAFVYDADNGALLMEYQLTAAFTGIVNDLTITQDAVYFTDSTRPVLYRLPLSANGRIPVEADAATEIPLPDEFELDFDSGDCCGGNGIVSTPNGKTLIVGHSNLARLYRVDPATGDVDQIVLDTPLSGFLDGIIMHNRTLYILTPGFPPPDAIQVVELDKNLLSGNIQQPLTGPSLDGVASGAIFGNSLYVNNARYFTAPGPATEYWLSKLRIRP